MKCFRCKTDADEDAAGKPSPSEFMIGPCVSYPANDPGEGSSLVLSYNHRRDQQGPLRSVWQHLAKSQDILKQRREAILLNFEVASVVTPLTILTLILPCPKILIGILLAINLNPTDYAFWNVEKNLQNQLLLAWFPILMEKWYAANYITGNTKSLSTCTWQAALYAIHVLCGKDILLANKK